MRYRLLFIIGILCSSVYANTVSWETMFAYNAVSQIAVSLDKVYALSDGALFSVNKQSEQIEVYNSGSGLHGKTIGSLYYDPATEILIIGYTDGKIDLLHDDGTIEYVSGLYTKDITATKTINNITVHNNQAYLSMDFGIVTFNLKKHVIVDTYYIGAEASEVKVNDILISGDSIYAFGNTLLYKACLSDNIVDYRAWQTEALGRIQRDANKGVLVTDSNGEVWEAGKDEGVVRHTVTGNTLSYKPDGPLVNTPYSMTVANGRLYVVSGGRWGVQYNRPGHVMIYDGDQWHNISQQTIQAATNGNPAKDFMDVAVDPMDAEHFFVTAYGGGVYEFQNYQVVQQYLPENSTLESRASNEKSYTRCSHGTFDKEGNFWCCNMGDVVLQRMDKLHQWNSVQITFEGGAFPVYTAGGLLLDKRNEKYKWVIYARATPGIILIDDKGTLEDTDDRVLFRNLWTNVDGQNLCPGFFYIAKQDEKHNVWLGTSSGVMIIPAEIDFFTSDICKQLDIVEDNGENPFTSLDVQAIEFDDKGRIWIGTNTVGVYVVSADWQTIVAHYTTDNSLMPSNYVMSLAFEPTNKKMFIGTDAGIAACIETSSSGGSGLDDYEETEEIDYGSMQQWTLHNSYTIVNRVAFSQTDVYALADGALFSLNKQSEEVTEWHKGNGLNGSNIRHIAFDKDTKQLIICYTDGKIDLLHEDGGIYGILDLYQKASTIAVTINSVYVKEGKAYLSMPFGIVVLNLRKAEIEDTYYIGTDANDVNVLYTTICGDSLYAISETDLHTACLKDNLVDYNYWHRCPLPQTNGNIQGMLSSNDCVYTQQDSTVYKRTNGNWEKFLEHIRWISGGDNGHLTAYQYGKGLLDIIKDKSGIVGDYWVNDALYDTDAHCYWSAVSGVGICKIGNGLQFYMPSGPINNNSYRLKFIGDELFVAGGGRWAVQYMRIGDFSIYGNEGWLSMPAADAQNKIGRAPEDIVSFAGNEKEPGHFYAATYGRGVFEYKDYQAIKNHNASNSTLISAAPNDPNNYTRTDGAMVDEEGNLWVLNTGDDAFPVNIMTPEKHWVGLELHNAANRQKVSLGTPWEIVVDKRDKQYKWFIDQRNAMIYLLNDGGTPTKSADDYCYGRREFYDQDGLQITPTTIYCLAQDNNNDIWIGTPTGVFIIPASVDFFTSNECYRVKIPRNDGTNLADYLLGTEQVNYIVVDGANRKWIGTENSGLYLMSADGLTTEAHFTTENSLLPSNTILSIAIHPTSGEVYVGTSNGLASYRSDASDPQEDYSNAYAFPNPVRHNYEGLVTITGLMENSVVNIVDEGGNLICKTRSNGGTAVWDGKNLQGQRASSGIYTALCNAPDGSHTAIKIMVMK